MRACLVEGEEESHLSPSVLLQCRSWDQVLRGRREDCTLHVCSTYGVSYTYAVHMYCIVELYIQYISLIVQ